MRLRGRRPANAGVGPSSQWRDTRRRSHADELSGTARLGPSADDAGDGAVPRDALDARVGVAAVVARLAALVDSRALAWQAADVVGAKTAATVGAAGAALAVVPARFERGKRSHIAAAELLPGQKKCGMARVRARRRLDVD